ncbi:hypothetical protein KI387_017681, partial [Taxus chinensis]
LTSYPSLTHRLWLKPPVPCDSETSQLYELHMTDSRPRYHLVRLDNIGPSLSPPYIGPVPPWLVGLVPQLLIEVDPDLPVHPVPEAVPIPVPEDVPVLVPEAVPMLVPMPEAIPVPVPVPVLGPTTPIAPQSLPVQ